MLSYIYNLFCFFAFHHMENQQYIKEFVNLCPCCVVISLHVDQVSATIHQEWRRLQRRRHLRVPGPSSPEMGSFSSYSPGSSPPRKEQPLFTLKQVTLICERMLKDRETQITEEYDKVLREKLAG